MRSANTALVGALAAAALTVVATGCQSTQSKSAEIAAALGPVRAEKGLKITEESKDVKVLDTTLLSDENGTAVVVEVENETDQTLVNVPLEIDVVDEKGKSVYTNTTPGLEPALTSIPILGPNQKLDWVHNQVLPAGVPDDVEVRVGADATPYDGEIPDIEVEEPGIENDPVSGVNASALAINKTGEDQDRLLLFGVARQGDEIVAAGRGAIEKLKADRQRFYHVYFIGDPKSAEVTIESFPTLTATQPDGGADDK